VVVVVVVVVVEVVEVVVAAVQFGLPLPILLWLCCSSFLLRPPRQWARDGRVCEAREASPRRTACSHTEGRRAGSDG